LVGVFFRQLSDGLRAAVDSGDELAEVGFFLASGIGIEPACEAVDKCGGKRQIVAVERAGKTANRRQRLPNADGDVDVVPFGGAEVWVSNVGQCPRQLGFVHPVRLVGSDYTKTTSGCA
jgi:hypothetical protein